MPTFTVRHLLEALSTCEPDALVLLWVDDRETGRHSHLGELKKVTDGCRRNYDGKETVYLTGWEP